MSSYIVLARKWRPQTFADLVGQQHIAVTLRNAIAQNRVAHAFLFTGSRGVGKTSTARIFAKALNCEHAPCDEPCNECLSCREITEGRAMDVIEIDGASNRGINEIREVLDAVRYAPSRDRYKIYIIDEVHMLTIEAFNALLKTLEEPPQHVVFIFATTDPNKIPITIVSRCQRYDFKRINEDDLAAHLGKIAEAEQIQFEESALRLIARTARGGVRDALSAMDQIIAFAEQPITGERAAEVLGVASRETLMKMGESVIMRNIDGALACIEKVDHYGQNLSQFAFDLLAFWRDVTVLAASQSASVELSNAEKELVKSWLPHAGFERLQRIFQIWYQTSEQLPKSLSPRLVMEMAAIKMCQVENVVPLDGILRKIDAISRALAGNINISPDSLSHIQDYLSRQGLAPLDEKKKLISSQILTDIQRVAQAQPGQAALPPKQEIQNSQAVQPGRPPVSSPQMPASPAFVPSVPVSSPVPAPSPAPSPSPAPVKPQERGGKSSDPLDNPPEFLDDIPWDDDSIPMSLGDMDSMSGGWSGGVDEEEEDEQSGADSPINASISKKTLEVSGEQPKTSAPVVGAKKAEPTTMQRWKMVVTKLGEPLASILVRARVDLFSRNSVEVTLSDAFESLITKAHIAEVDRILSHDIYQSCRFVVRFSEIDDEADTLAAMDAKARLEAQQQAFNEVREHPVMKTIIEVFHVNPDEIRFTINPDRTSQ